VGNERSRSVVSRSGLHVNRKSKSLEKSTGRRRSLYRTGATRPKEGRERDGICRPTMGPRLKFKKTRKGGWDLGKDGKKTKYPAGKSTECLEIAEMSKKFLFLLGW